MLDADIKYPLGIYEDQAFSIMAYAATDRIWSIPGAFYIYRQLENSVVHAKNYNKITKVVESLIVNLRMVQEMPDKACESLDEEFMAQVYLRFFRIFFDSLPCYYNGSEIPEKVYSAVEAVVKKYFPRDVFLVSVLLHYACSMFQENEKKISQIKSSNEKM